MSANCLWRVNKRRCFNFGRNTWRRQEYFRTCLNFAESDVISLWFWEATQLLGELVDGIWPAWPADCVRPLENRCCCVPSNKNSFLIHIPYRSEPTILLHLFFHTLKNFTAKEQHPLRFITNSERPSTDNAHPENSRCVHRNTNTQRWTDDTTKVHTYRFYRVDPMLDAAASHDDPEERKICFSKLLKILSLSRKYLLLRSIYSLGINYVCACVYCVMVCVSGHCSINKWLTI